MLVSSKDNVQGIEHKEIGMNFVVRGIKMADAEQMFHEDTGDNFTY